jgi:MoaA/NifB/PqqE/SkfB family radical SAM enzyme
MMIHELKKKLMADPHVLEHDKVWEAFELCRSRTPVIYNLETTNACNMRCVMCPRTTMMTRPVKTMELRTAKRVIEQLEPWSEADYSFWEEFVASNYGIPKDDMSENHFFLYVIPKVLVLHGYGDPLLDPHIPAIVEMLTKRNIPSYFSCNPANIDLKRTMATFDAGLSYIKYSIESVDDLRHKQIRGQASNFTTSYNSILHLLNQKAQKGWKTEIVITMLNLNKRDETEEFERLKQAFIGQDVYIYLKSQDQVWYENKPTQTKSIHWLEFCQFPWSSMTIKSDGFAAQCVEDFNNEIILGDAKTESLQSIWNGEKYRQLRHDHFTMRRGIKCSEQCDMMLVGQLLKG